MIDIVIVNWNSGIQLKQCIDSILAHSINKISRIIIVDNGSIDCSADSVEDLSKVELIRAGENLGFGAACNIGAKAGDAPYILFLNPDTRIESNSLSVPLVFMEQAYNSKVGICGIQLVDEQGVVSRSCAYSPTFKRLFFSAIGLDKFSKFKSTGIAMSTWNHLNTQQVDQVIGAFYFIRRNVFESCKGFDEQFFVYFEEVDVAKRIKDLGWTSWYLTEAKAFHAGGGTSQQVKAHRLFYILRSRLLYAFKHFPRWQASLLLIVVFLVEPFTRTIWCLIRRDITGIKHTWSAFRMLGGSVGNILRNN
ncbi:glycosyltransferase family 2 protein [Psychrobacter cryohalolentis]|uniref:Glycosyl transferase, family 2 n=1 Tax=Psychrobacter cryohalolentis (strain ATCC BAA-1226 / DSM 17306 / VKM B-2378 / K5) TaxID=335284 RepID=Q1QD42_PSYCK|nr:glycosyltransferase family 2 protein [Psychrobacter cryohalolentis]ABE74411.1 glycosyl transferase, family 2 [Psychrobacter cryohalolentis K5]ASE27529.1 glycosyltransferase family 2 protein [Psychrobacter cryohalolentis]